MAMVPVRLSEGNLSQVINERYGTYPPKDTGNASLAGGWTETLRLALASTRGILVFKRAKPESATVVTANKAGPDAAAKPQQRGKKDRSAYKKLAPTSAAVMPSPDFMMQMMQAGAAAPRAQAPKQQQQLAQPDDAGGAKAVQMVQREGGVLNVSKGMDPAVVAAKIQEIAVSIIGDDEGLDADTPLMQAGLTSNTAVMLRDELSKDIPGVNLPPTLMFDYPSITAIAEFIVERAK